MCISGSFHSLSWLALHRFSNAFQCRNPLPRRRLQLPAQHLRVVGDQFGPVARPADLDVETFLRGEVRMVGFDLVD